ncbi:MAG: prolipoprotein diacylglyceryl transferase, partial [Chloroflexi bacterium]|nr:prolipoprotein diacylglyceryl transferase [Chloroflexota bacterium]
EPVFIHVGHFTVQWYGVGIAAAIAVGFFVALREAKRKGISQDDVYSMGTWVVIAGIVGARLLHVIDKLDYYLANPGSIIAIQGGGLAIYGAILGGAMAGIIYVRRRRLPLGKMTDAIAPALILGQAIGRIGCTINGDAVGSPTDLPWGFVYINPGAMAPSLGQAYQPTQVYEMVADLLIFGLLWWARDRIKVDGLLFLLYLTLYSIVKFTVSFWRQEAIFLFGMQEAQVVSLAGLAFATILAVNLLTRTQVQRVRSAS